MKIIHFKPIIIISVIVFAISSCKKDYSCSCTTTTGTVTENHPGSSAEDACADATSVLEGKVCTAN